MPLQWRCKAERSKRQVTYPGSMNSHFVQEEGRASSASARWSLSGCTSSSFFLCSFHRFDLEYGQRKKNEKMREVINNGVYRRAVRNKHVGSTPNGVTRIRAREGLEGCFASTEALCRTSQFTILGHHCSGKLSQTRK